MSSHSSRPRMRKVKSSRLVTSKKQAKQTVYAAMPLRTPMDTSLLTTSHVAKVPAHTTVGTPRKHKMRRRTSRRKANVAPVVFGASKPTIPLAYWHHTQVAAWLGSLDLTQYSTAFAKQGITGTVLLSSYFTPKLLLEFVRMDTMVDIITLFDALDQVRATQGMCDRPNTR